MRPHPCPGLTFFSISPRLSRSSDPAQALGVSAQGRNPSEERGWRQDCDSLRDYSLPLPIRWPIWGEKKSTQEVQFNSLQFDTHLLSICCVPGTVPGAGAARKALTE